MRIRLVEGEIKVPVAMRREVNRIVVGQLIGFFQYCIQYGMHDPSLGTPAEAREWVEMNTGDLAAYLIKVRAQHGNVGDVMRVSRLAANLGEPLPPVRMYHQTTIDDHYYMSREVNPRYGWDGNEREHALAIGVDFRFTGSTRGAFDHQYPIILINVGNFPLIKELVVDPNGIVNVTNAEVKALLLEVQAVVEHELSHFIQFETFGKKDPRQIGRNAGYSDKDNRSDYLTSQVEFDPMIKTYASGIVNTIPLAMWMAIVRKESSFNLVIRAFIDGKSYVRVPGMPMDIRIATTAGRLHTFLTALRNNDESRYRKAAILIYKGVAERLGERLDQHINSTPENRLSGLALFA